MTGVETSSQSKVKEPGFEELLCDPKPLNPMPISKNRPKLLLSYVDRDEEHFHKVSKRRQAVLVYVNLSLAFEIYVDKIVEYATQTGLVSEKEVFIAKITEKKYVLFIHEGLVAETIYYGYTVSTLGHGFLLSKIEQKKMEQR